MSGLCGWFGRPSNPEGASGILQSMVGTLSRFDGSPVQIQHGNRHGMAVAAPAGRASAAVSNRCAAVVWGTPSFNDDTLAHVARTSGSAMAVIDAFRRYGAECCTRLGGAFAVAVADGDSGDALLAIDRMGVHNLIYTETNQGIVFASSAVALHAHPATMRDVDWQSIYHYVHFHTVPGPATAFRNEQRLLPGQFLHVRNGNMRLGRYWQMQFVEDEERPFAESRDEFLGILTDAVRRMGTSVPTGAFLSGGTDSSTVSGLLGKVTGKPAETFSIGFAEPGYDEMEYARIAARHFKTAQHEYYVTAADIVEAVPRLAAIYDQPFGNSSAVPTYCCARFARENAMQLLLGGDGGDELFGGNERYATQYRYSLYEKVPGLIRRGVLEPLGRTLPGGGKLPPIRWYRRLVELASTPMPDRTDAHNLLVRLGIDNVFTPDMLARVEIGGPQRLMREVYDETKAGSLINKMLAYDFRFTLADTDIPKVMKSCELAGLPVDFPMLDDGLVAFSARLTPEMKLKGTKLRYFFKEALRGFLPDEIISKTKHGFGLPFGPWLRSHKPLEELVMDSLGKLRGRGFVRSDFLTKLMGTHLAEHPGYYGTMAWVLMMLELWFQHHCDRPA
ncbi:MAG: asparagine synthase [Betaproteobacteria bacterium]|nr:asparagine synthase [Betaproteobacteria bacterium]